jgi:hypothetical protein
MKIISFRAFKIDCTQSGIKELLSEGLEALIASDEADDDDSEERQLAVLSAKVVSYFFASQTSWQRLMLTWDQ